MTSDTATEERPRLDDGEVGAAERWMRTVKHLVVFAVVIGTWEAITRGGLVDVLILPAPSSIVESFYRIAIGQGLIWSHFGITLYEALFGFVIGVAAGVGFAIACAFSPGFRRYVSPYIICIQVTPRIALAPIIIAWLGFGLQPKIAIAALVCFFPPFINTLTGLLEVDQEKLEMFRSLQAKRKQIFFQLMLPGAMPVMMAGIKTAMAFALIGAIVGEFVSASAGMGILLQRFTFALDMASAFAILVSLMLMGLALFWLMETADNHFVFWRHDRRLTRAAKKQAARYKSLLEHGGAVATPRPAPAE